MRKGLGGMMEKLLLKNHPMAVRGTRVLVCKDCGHETVLHIL
ncbi:MAG: hypothetical protein ACI4NA_05015 [Succinivibrio sp.]